MDVGALDSGWGCWGDPGSESSREGCPVQGRLSLQWPFNKPLSSSRRSGNAMIIAAVPDARGRCFWSGWSWVEGQDRGPVGLPGLQRARPWVSAGQLAEAHVGRCSLGNGADRACGHVVSAEPQPGGGAGALPVAVTHSLGYFPRRQPPGMRMKTRTTLWRSRRRRATRPVSPSTCSLSAVSSGMGPGGSPQDTAPEGGRGSSLGPQSGGPASGVPSPCHVVLGSLPSRRLPLWSHVH